MRLVRHDITEDNRIRVQVLLDPECDIPGVPPVQSLGLNEELSKLSIIHVAGTKGKGSTCAMVESMLRTAGYRTGLFTSPHLLDVRERIRIDGYGSFRPGRDRRTFDNLYDHCSDVRARDCCSVPVEKAAFLQNLWWCLNRLKGQEAGMPAYFRFLTLLGWWPCLHSVMSRSHAKRIAPAHLLAFCTHRPLLEVDCPNRFQDFPRKEG